MLLCGTEEGRWISKENCAKSVGKRIQAITERDLMRHEIVEAYLEIGTNGSKPGTKAIAERDLMRHEIVEAYLEIGTNGSKPGTKATRQMK
jgi:gamma-glutamyl:cysteine ligase YbdK (ATP-grasp superfamily)